MKTQHECTQERNLCDESLTTEAMNDESITAKVRSAIEEWDEPGKGGKLNRFRNAGTNAAPIKSARESDQ